MRLTALKTIIIILCFLEIACSPESTKNNYKDFDLPLLKNSDRLMSMGDYKGFMQLQNNYLKIADEKKCVEGRALVYLNLFRINYAQDNPEKAFYYINKADSLLKNSNDNVHKAMLYDQLSAYNNYLKMYDNSIYYNDKAIEKLNNVKNTEIKNYILASIYSNRGYIFNDKTKYNSANIYYYKSMQLKEDIELECVMARRYIARGKMDSANIHIDRMKSIFNKPKEPMYAKEKFLFFFTLGRYYESIKNYRKAEDAYDKSQYFEIQIRSVYGYFPQFHKFLETFYSKIGKKEKADYFMNMYKFESIKTDSNLKRSINPAINKFVVDFREKDEKDKKYLILFITIIVIGIIILVFFIKRRIKSLQTNKKLLKLETDTLKNLVHDKRYEEVIALAKKNDSYFLAKFKEVYPNFIIRVLELNPDLESSELVFCAFLKLNFTSKEIATYTFVQLASVQQRKRRLRKRLGISSDKDLYIYFNNL